MYIRTYILLFFLPQPPKTDVFVWSCGPQKSSQGKGKASAPPAPPKGAGKACGVKHAAVQ